MQTENPNPKPTGAALGAPNIKADMPTVLRAMGLAIIAIGTIAAFNIWPPAYTGPRGFYNHHSSGMNIQHWASIGVFSLSVVFGMMVTGVGTILHEVRKSRASLKALLEHHGIAEKPETQPQPAPVATPAE